MELENVLSVYRGDYRYLVKRVPAACLSSDAVGDVVCIRGDRINGKIRVQKASSDYRDRMPGIGILISKSTPTVCVVQEFGRVEGVFSGLIPGKHYHVDSSGGLVIVPPLAGVNGYAMLQQIGFAEASDILLLTGNLSMMIRR